jgi:hypothetical protein
MPSTATDLAPALWNAIADEIRRQQSSREIFFVKVTKVDTKRKIVWADDFGSMGIPLVTLPFQFDYYDGTPTGVIKKTAIPEVMTPKVGQTIVVLDAWGAKRFPVCIGILQSKPGFWEES